MPRIFILTFVLFLVPRLVHAQINPKEGSVLNYRLIGFSSFEIGKEAGCVIEIAPGYYCSEDSFKKNIVKKYPCKGDKIIGEVPYFGFPYTWRVARAGKNPASSPAIFHHFNTGIIPQADPNSMRLRVLHPASKYKDAHVFLDGSRTLCDMKGNPVWYLPDIPGAVQANTLIRDLKLTPKGTITFIAGITTAGKIYEVNYCGDILWKGPDNGLVSGDSQENYHHEFTMLSNGHYMVLGAEMFSFRLPVSADSPLVVYYGDTSKEYRKNRNYKEIPFGTIIEYDETGKIVWSWKSSGYFRNSDLIYRKKPVKMDDIDVHDNAFFFDEKEKMVYLSFKNISRIIKIKYPEGNVTKTYGEKYKPGASEHKTGLFCGQHSCRLSSDRELYLLNNNACNMGAAPKIMLMEEPGAKGDALKTIWEYNCLIDGVNTNKETPHVFEFSGNVYELPDHSFFGCITGSETAVFIVGKDKKIAWSAELEKWDQEEGKWFSFRQYRASIITNPQELQRLVWNTGIKNN